MYLLNDRKGWLSIRVNYLLLIFFLLSAPIIVKAQASYADFKVPELVCEGLEYEFENTSYLKPGDTATYKWSFEDALSQNALNGTVQWEHLSDNRTVTATLTMHLQNGDSSVLSKNVEVLRRPFSDFDSTSFCEMEEVDVKYKTITHDSEEISCQWLGDLDSSDHWRIRHTDRVEKLSLICTYNSGCSDTASKNVFIRAAPDATFTFNIVYYRNRVEFNAPSGYSIYSWRFGDGGWSSEEDPTYTYHYVQKGDSTYFEVCLDVKNDKCWNGTCQNVPIILNINDLYKAEFSLFPNPITDYVEILSSKQLEFKLFDLQGKELNIHGVSRSAEGYKLNFTLNDGVYHLQISDGENLFIKKLIINKNN